MRDFQGKKLLIGIFEVRDVDAARIRITLHARIRAARENATGERTNERCRRM